MRASVFASTIVLGAIAAGSALAGAEQPYLGLRGSFAEVEDSSAESALTNFDIGYNNGFGASASLGVRMPHGLRAEAEVMFQSADVESFTITKDLINLPPLTGDAFIATGEAEVIAPMANIYYDLTLPDLMVRPYVGAGIGGAHLNLNAENGPLIINIDDDNWAFAWQLMAGVVLPVSEQVALTAGYRYFSTNEMALTDDFGTEYTTQYQSHNFDIGLQLAL